MSKRTKETTKFVTLGTSVFVNKYYYDKLERQNAELLESMKAASNWIKNCSTPQDAAHELDLAIAKAEGKV